MEQKSDGLNADARGSLYTFVLQDRLSQSLQTLLFCGALHHVCGATQQRRHLLKPRTWSSHCSLFHSLWRMSREALLNEASEASGAPVAVAVPDLWLGGPYGEWRGLGKRCHLQLLLPAGGSTECSRGLAAPALCQGTKTLPGLCLRTWETAGYQ